MSKNKNNAANNSKKHAIRYVRPYGFDLLKQVDPFFLEEGEFEKAQQEHEQLAQLFEGSVFPGDAIRKDFVSGTVVSQAKEGFYVNIGRKYDGFVPASEAVGLAKGDEAEFYVIAGPDKKGIATLSFNMARGWRTLEAAQESGEVFNARVFSEAITKRNQKSAGLRIVFEEGDLKGIRGFVPNVEISRNTRSRDLVDTVIQVTVIRAEADRGSEYGNLVASHKQAQGIADEISFNNMQPNEIVSGTIIDFIKAGVNDTKMSALVKLENGLVGMLHRSETLDNRDSLSDMYRVGDTITTAVRKIDHEKKRIALSLKLAAQLNCISQIEPNVIVEARILREVVYGYFASIGGGMEGLIHKSDLAQVNGRPESFKSGEITQVVVLSFEADGTRLALGRKQLFPNK
ncbi:MAG: 30S ribosomal protein S1 [Cyanobacteria bacterium SZAS TMP-1]|nr:30S ribosomal protein S1 [Cyanobacteria bacterium SZAS TMP-1]